MPTFRTGEVVEILEEDPGLQALTVRVDGDNRRAVLFTRYAPAAHLGDSVVLNTTANELELGSGGEDFVVWNLSHEAYDSRSAGHIMKLRYTPLQTEVLAVESPESEYHTAMRYADGLQGMPVLAASLHSQLLPVVMALKRSRPRVRLCYVMTDGGALEASLSKTVRRLRGLGWLSAVVTIGHAVGGDLEAVNVYSGLLAARHVVKADVAVVGMGPGVVGTSTSFGTTALEMGSTLNAGASLGGAPVAVVRMSSAEQRTRHRGMSHHAFTALTRVALTAVDVPIPLGHAAGLEEIAARHRVIEVDAERVLGDLDESRGIGLEPSHMGRGPEGDRLFFLAAGAAGYHAAALLEEG